MPYYKVAKQDFLNFIKEYQEPSLYVPQFILNKSQINIINYYYSQAIREKKLRTFKEISESQEIEKVFLNKLLNYFFTEKENSVFFKSLANKYGVSENVNSYRITLEEVPKLLVTTFEEKINILVHLKDDFPKLSSKDKIVQEYSIFLLAKFLNQESRVSSYPHIQSLILANKQQHIIDVKFGNDSNVPTQPVVNADGLYQTYALNYIDDNDIIIHSSSDEYIIQESLNNYSPLNILNEEEYQHLLKTNEFYLNLNDLLSTNTFIEENKSKNKTIEIVLDFIDEQCDLFNYDKTSEDDKFDIFINALKDFTIHRKDNFFTQIKNMSEYISSNLETTYFDKYIKALRSNFDEIYLIEQSLKSLGENIEKEFATQTEAQRAILYMLSPVSKSFHKKELSSKFTIELQKTLSPQELNFLLFYGYQDYRGHLAIIGTSSSDVNFSFGHRGNEPRLNNATQFTPLMTSFINEIKNNPHQENEKLNSSLLFRSLQQDIYTLLPLKHKMHEDFYSCILKENHLPTLNEYFLNISLPGNLLLNDKIYFSLLDQMHERFMINSVENYFSEALTIRFFHFFEDFDTNPRQIPENYFRCVSEPSSAKDQLNNFKLNIYKSAYNNTTISNILKYKNFLEESNIDIQSDPYLKDLMSYMHFEKPTFNIQEAKSIISTLKSFELLKNAHVSSLLDHIIQHPEFSNNEHDYILNLYKEYNNCFSVKSKTATINFFRKNFKKIFEHHENENTFSKNDFLNSSSFDINSRSSNFYTKPLIQEIQKNEGKYLSVFPNLLKVVPNELINDKEFIYNLTLKLFNKTFMNDNFNRGKKIISEYSSFINNDYFNDYEFFKRVYNTYLLQENLDPKIINFSYQSSLPDTQIPNFIEKFNPIFFNKEEVVLKTLEVFKETQKTNGPTGFLNCLSPMNYELHQLLVKIIREKNGNFDEVINNIKNIQMTRTIFVHEKEITSNATSLLKF